MIDVTTLPRSSIQPNDYNPNRMDEERFSTVLTLTHADACFDIALREASVLTVMSDSGL